MRYLAAFAAGLLVAGVLAAVAARLSTYSREVHTASDVHHPLNVAFESIERAAAQGDCRKAAAQLRVLKQRYDEFSQGGPAPELWINEVVAAITQPAN